MAQHTGSRAIFDLSTMGPEALHPFLQTADPAGHVSDIKISASALMHPSVGRLLKETGARNLWVECHSHTSPGDPSALLRQLRTLSDDCRCFPIVGDVPLLAAMVQDVSGIGRIVLKGCEAAGFVSGETTLVLYAAAREMLLASEKSLDVLIWGGVSTPEAAAAFLSTGAAGIVFESVHWLTDLVVMDDRQRRQLARLRMDSTALVGLDLQVPCRLFNKGNSLAFKRIKAFEDSLCAAEIKDESRRAFVGQVQASTLHPLDSHFTKSEVIPLGVEAAFAASFAERFGTGTENAVKAFMAEIRNLCGAAEAKKDCFLDSPVAREMGIKYPFIQGAMSSITDIPEFASEIADAGGLPTIALGLMDAQACDRRLGRLPEIMGGRPYAVNIISLTENPFRETHLAWIKQHRPRFVWIAGGDLSPIRELLQCGIGVVYIAPDEALLKLALEAGVRYVVCEGYEAGGHVGQHSTLTLAQMVLDFKRRQPSLFQDCRVILAGGIFNRETAFIAGLLGADAIQMGTAYLATREIVETGALAALYQRMIVESPPGGTIISGQSTGLRGRSLRTPRVAAVLALEREFAAGHQDEESFRKRMEEMTAGSLCVAARGMDRHSGRLLDEQVCLERGQFMSGSCAGLISKVQKLASFHHELAKGPLLLHQPFATSTARIPTALPHAPLPAKTPTPAIGRGPKGVARLRDDRDRVAISGMSVLNALGKSPEEVWAASLAMKSGVTLVPSSRWNHDLFYDPRPRVTDKTYCQVGAFVNFPVSRNELGIPPQDFRTMTSATRTTLWLAQGAIRDSGILESGIPRERIAVLISQNSGEAAGTLTDMIIREYVHEILPAVKRAVPLTPDQESAIEREVKSGRMAPDDTTLLGRLNCTAAGFICNRYGFMGPSYAVSAACSTSLVAIYSALQMIRNGIIDAAVVGGGEDSLSHLHFLEFSALGALYGLSGRPRPPHEASCPFDAERDGMVLAEGGGMIVIERESLARARGAAVHAVVTGMGASNNHLGMVESSSVTQEIAIRTSFQGARYGPDAVDLVECHATSTRQGDVEEVRALKAFFPPSKRTVITSYKSQIGHTLGASGINSLIRGVMAMKAGVFPPTLNYRHPDPEMALEGSGLLIAQEPLDWRRRNGLPRRFQVNAFGFGGSNYVVQVEQALNGEDAILVSTGRQSRPVTETVDGPAALPGISFFRTGMAGRTCRMAVVAPSAEEALAVIERSASLAEAAISSPKAARSLAQQGLFLRPEGPPVAPLALVFPGQGAQYAGMGQALYESFPVIREWMDRTAAAADFDLLHLLFHDREENLQKTRWQQPALFAMEHAMARHLLALGIRPVAMAGHSLGELAALCLAGVYSLEDGFRIVNQRALCMDKAAAMHGDPGVMAATDAPLDVLNEWIRGEDDVHLSNINSPMQIVLSGNTGAVQVFGNRLKEQGYRFTLLRVSMAFHSPIMRIIHDELEAFIATIPLHPPEIPVLSNTTMTPYPSDPGEIRRILMAHLESPVHWMENARTLWNDYGIRLFVEVGPGDTLSNLIADTIPEPLCLQTCLPDAECHTFRTALAQLFVHGSLQVRGGPRFISLPSSRPPDRPPSTPDRQAAPASAEAPERQDHLEAIIRIIMDATGFDRDEIQPDMDLRRDLSVRSSRLPIIMDAAEHHFGITIELEDFLQVRTVRDIARRITTIVARQGGLGDNLAARAADSGAAPTGIPEPSADEARLKRLVFDLAPVQPTAFLPVELSPGETVLLLSPNQDDALARSAGDLLRQEYGVDTVALPFRPEPLGSGVEGLASLAGLVLTLPEGGSERVAGMADVSRLLTGFFQLLKAFLQLPTGKFVLLIHAREDTDTPDRLLMEGLLGLFLSAAQEHPAVQFRTMEIDRNTDLSLALRAALDKGCATVELIHREGKVFTSRGHPAPAVFGDPPSLKLNPGDVVVMSGGATGISAHLARGLVPFAPRLVFLGRTQLEPHPEPSCPASIPDESRAREIAQTLADLQASGIDATYLACDVTDPDAVRVALGEVVDRFGRIDGIIHGAGVLRDGFLGQMTPEDFSLVADGKFLGAWNLFSAAEGAGLRFFVGLSSVAAIQGNLGQTNYAAANRMMSALLRYLRRKNSAIRFKALMLPPVEGTGMAENPEVRDLLRRRGVAYVHVQELVGLFCRELFVAPADDDWVMFIRALPSVKTAPLGEISHPALSGQLDGGLLAFSPRDFPMIDGLSCLDLRGEHLEASRSFSRQKDLWIADHRPLKSLAHPLVSAAMMLETFMESARILYPHLQVRGVRQVRFMDIISCPPDVPRSSRISCRRAGADPREVVCEASLSVKEISPTGRLADRFIPHCTGQVLLGGGRTELVEWFQDFPILADELRSQPVNHEKVLKWYEDHTGLDGRYRVLEVIDGAGPGLVRGRTIYRETDDFAHLHATRYQYSPYLFEALMQLAVFQMLAIDQQDRRSMLPTEIGEMRFLRQCRPGEQIILEARLRDQDQESLAWDARGIDDQGLTVMQVRTMRMHWV
jgi:acyl transferase domain-containing protein/NAD(P)H-dependent flavin oxidoreductase YrpB (nitropropane dioxygenase family)/NAD(P)-dependent dehydrogenase (short-subunit alcohol dehydrogenase family)/acyl carrier protein